MRQIHQPISAAAGNHGDHDSQVVVHHAAEEAHNLRAKANHQKRQEDEAQEASEEDGGQEVAEAHLGHAGGQHEQLERRRRRQHGGQHDGEKFVAIERGLDLVEALLAHALDQQHLAAFVADDVDDDAAQRRAGRRHGAVQHEAMGMGPDVAGDDGVERHAEERRVHGGKAQDAPDAQRLQHGQDQDRLHLLSRCFKAVVSSQ